MSFCVRWRTPVGADLLANAVCQPTSSRPDTPSSRASPLPQRIPAPPPTRPCLPGCSWRITAIRVVSRQVRARRRSTLPGKRSESGSRG
ncbi:hypothetical protein C9422_17370 [Pseudomonas sp. B1(2018)]|nr:hypothetical protein C9422_17370 [Pseudomonas sp. B1(2018)]